MKYWLGTATAGIFIILSIIHIYWAMGGDWGKKGVIPEVNGKRIINPTPQTTLLVAGALLTAAIITLGQIGYLGSTIPRRLYKIGTFGISIVFFLRFIGDFRAVGIFKAIKDTEFAYWDTRLYSPLCLLIFCSTLIIGLLEE